MLRVGFSRIDITPPVGCCLQGHFKKIVSTGIHDPLYASALYLDDGATQAAMISCDVIGISKETVADARKRIEAMVGLGADQVLICATHTHTGPTVLDRKMIADANDVTPEWLAAWPDRIATAVVEAKNAARETRLCCMSGEEHDVSFGRRYLRDDGAIISIGAPGDPTLVKALVPIDPEVGVVAFGQDETQLQGLLVNFALHLDTMDGNLISADFPGVMRDALLRQFGEIGTVYTSGAMGNINHYKALAPPRWREYFECARRTGMILAGEVVKTVNRMDAWTDDAVVRVARKEIALPLKSYTDDELAAARAMIATKPEDWHTFLSALGIARSAHVGGGAYTTEIMALRLGDIGFVAIPGEYFVEFGLQIKEQSPFAKTFVIELAGDYAGYIGTAAAYDEGGYETLSTALACGAGEQITQEALDLLSSLAD